MKHKRWLLLAVCAAILWGAVRLLYFFYPPPPPMWPHEVVAVTPHGLWYSPYSSLTAQLTGEGGLEVVSIEGPHPPGTLRVYEYSEDFTPLVETEVPRLRWSPIAAGDFTGDGQDDLFFIDQENRVVTARLFQRRLDFVHAQRLTDHWIQSLLVADLRSTGRPELLLFVQGDRPYSDAGGVKYGTLLVAHGWDGDGWAETWRQEFSPPWHQFAQAGDYFPRPGEELLLSGYAYDPEGACVFHLLGWDGETLARLWEQTFPPEVFPRWLTAWSAPGSSRRIVSYTGTPPFADPPGGEILEFDGHRLRTRYVLPGEPVLVGDFRGNGKTGILLLGDDRDAITYTLLEARR